MDLFKLLSLKGQLEEMKLSDDPAAFMPALKALGVEDLSVAEKVLTAARAVTHNPEQTVAEFVSNGGLMRLLAGEKAGDDEDVILQCPHCKESIFVHVAM
jgi:hypothetical protein